MFYADSAAPRPATRWDPVPSHDAETRARGFLDPAYLTVSVWRARWMVLALGLAGVVAASAFAVSQPKQYTASAQIVLDPRDLNLMQNEVTPAASGLNTDAALALIESQIAVITSNSVLERVVEEASLTSDPEFNGLSSTWLSSLSATLAALIADDPEESARDRALLTVNNLYRHVSVSRNANSFVINLAVRSEDPQKAARLANLATDVFIAEQGRAQSDLARRATTALSSRLAELRTRVVEAEDAVESYKAENRLVGVGGRLIDDEYITRSNNQLADVRSQITALNVRARSLREASVEDVAAGSFPEGLNSESLLRLRQIYSEAAQNQAILATRLGPRHPQRIAADQAVSTARRAIGAELSRIVASAQTELARAQATEADLSGQIDTLRSRQIETSGSFVRLRELEREVDASRAVYEAYLLRARQTSEQESLNTSNVRVISDATVPLQPSSLSRKIVVVAGLIAGIAAGVALALALAVMALLRGGAGAAQASPEPAAADWPAQDIVAQPVSPERTEAETAAASDWGLHHPTGAYDTAATGATDDEPRSEPATAQGRSSGNADEFGAEWALRGAAHDGPENQTSGEAPWTVVATAPALDAAAEADRSPSAGHDIEQRREALRQRIRDLGTRRSIDPVAGFERADDGDELDARRERISLRLAAARQRRQTPIPADAEHS